jgi:hypothetical protein
VPGSISNRLFETTDAGRIWTLLDPGLTASSVDFVSARTGFATQVCWGAALGCSNPMLWVTHDAGQSWTQLHPRLVSGRLSASIPDAWAHGPCPWSPMVNVNSTKLTPGRTRAVAARKGEAGRSGRSPSPSISLVPILGAPRRRARRSAPSIAHRPAGSGYWANSPPKSGFAEGLIADRECLGRSEEPVWAAQRKLVDT